MRLQFLLLFVIAAAAIGVYFKFADNLEKIPMGCDEFGYMHMSQAMHNGNTFNEHTSRPFMNELLSYLRNNNISETEIRWMVVPHAYYVMDSSNLIINQYAPGTSFLLSFFPLEWRKQLSAPLMMILLLLIPLTAFYSTRRNQITLAYLFLLLFAFYATIAPPLLTELTRINSVIPTIGLLITAGFFLDSKPLLSCFLIAITANFRQVNLLMLIPLFMFIPFPSRFDKEGMMQLSKTGLKYIGVVILALLPYFFYMYQLTGNPFLLSYSSIDTKTTSDVISNLQFYFNINNGWFQLHLLFVSLIVIFILIKRISLKIFTGLLLFVIINYTFFLFHHIQINYYPYASSIILFGFLLKFAHYRKINIKYDTLILVACVLISSVILLDGIVNRKKPISYQQAEQPYQTLCNYNIVWGDLIPSASEYVCKNNAFKFATTTQKARAAAIRFLYDKGYSQAFIINDIPVPASIIFTELQELNLPFATDNSSSFGTIITLKP